MAERITPSEYSDKLAETAKIVGALRLILRTEYDVHQNASAMEIAWGILEKAGIATDDGLDIPQEIWLLVNNDVKQLTL